MIMHLCWSWGLAFVRLARYLGRLQCKYFVTIPKTPIAGLVFLAFGPNRTWPLLQTITTPQYNLGFLSFMRRTHKIAQIGARQSRVVNTSLQYSRRRILSRFVPGISLAWSFATVNYTGQLYRTLTRFYTYIKWTKKHAGMALDVSRHSSSSHSSMLGRLAA